MMDKQLNVIKTYWTDCVLRGLLVCFEGFIRLPFGVYVISSLYHMYILLFIKYWKVRYKRCYAIVCIVAFYFFEQIKA